MRSAVDESKEKNKQAKNRDGNNIVLVRGEIEEVIQADKEATPDSVADRVESWLFEVALKIVEAPKRFGEPDLKGRDMKENPIQILSLGERPPANRKHIWRCRACFEERFTTIWGRYFREKKSRALSTP